MPLLPYRKIELSSPLAPDAVVRALEKAVEPNRWFGFGSGARPFEGTVTPSTFDIRRTIFYRNSFLPQIRGTITPDGSGSRISITMQLHVTVVIFMAVWLGAIFFGVTASAPDMLASRMNLGPALVPIAMLLFGSILTVGSFAFEARKAERLLVSLLAAVRRPDDPIQEKPPGFF